MTPSIQNSSLDFTDFPKALSEALPRQLSSTDAKVQTVVDWHAWETAAKTLHIDVDAAINLIAEPEEKDGADENGSTEKSKIYQNAIDSHYQYLNDAFLLELNKAKEEIEGMDYDSESIAKFIASIPEEKNAGPLSHAKYNKTLREFIHANRNAEIFDPIIFGAIENLQLLQMLIEEGVKPNVPPLPEGTRCDDKEALGWAILISTKPDFPSNPEFCKLILNNHHIDPQGLTYLLWLVCQSPDSDSETEQLEVIKFLLSKGASWDVSLLAAYPPIALSNTEEPLTFVNDSILNDKKEIRDFMRAQQVISNDD